MPRCDTGLGTGAAALAWRNSAVDRGQLEDHLALKSLHRLPQRGRLWFLWPQTCLAFGLAQVFVPSGDGQDLRS